MQVTRLLWWADLWPLVAALLRLTDTKWERHPDSKTELHLSLWCNTESVLSGQTLCSVSMTCLGVEVMYSLSAVPCAAMLCWLNTMCVSVSASYPLHVWCECLPSPWSDRTQTGLTILGLSRGLDIPNLSALQRAHSIFSCSLSLSHTHMHTHTLQVPNNSLTIYPLQVHKEPLASICSKVN